MEMEKKKKKKQSVVKRLQEYQTLIRQTYPMLNIKIEITCGYAPYHLELFYCNNKKQLHISSGDTLKNRVDTLDKWWKENEETLNKYKRDE